MKIANYKLLKENYFNKKIIFKISKKNTYLLNNEIANFIY